ncbi:MAG: CHAT domain-containing protein [Aureispira sp.]|nr:CHAT domain-containing protein [Aureispira sp.]
MYPYAQAAEQRALEEYGILDTLYTRLLFQLGYAYDYGIEDAKKAMECYENARIIQAKLNPISIDYARTLETMGGLYDYAFNDLDKAEPFYLKALVIIEQVKGRKDKYYAEVLSELGATYRSYEYYDKAEVTLKEVLGIEEQILGTDAYQYTVSLSRLGLLYRLMGRYEEAEALYLKALKVRARNKAKDIGAYSRTLDALAGIYVLMGRYEEAEPLFLECLDIDRNRKSRAALVSYAISLNNLAGLYEKQDEYVKSKKCYLESKAIMAKQYGKENYRYGTVINNLADIYSKMKDYEAAESLLLEAISILKKSYGEGHARHIAGLMILAKIYRDQDKFSVAEDLCIKALEICEQKIDVHHHRQLILLNTLGLIYIKKNRFSEAWETIDKATISNCKLSIKRPFTIESIKPFKNAEYESVNTMTYTLKNVRDLLIKEDSIANANEIIQVGELAKELLKKEQDELLGGDDKLRMLASSTDWMLKSLPYLEKEKKIEEAFEFAEWNKSVLLMESIKTERAYDFGYLPDSLVKKEKDLKDKQTELKALLLEVESITEEDQIRTKLNETNLEMIAFKEHIEKVYPKYASLKYDRTQVSLPEIQGLLNEQAAFLEYVLGDSTIYIFYVDKKETKLFKQDIAPKALQKELGKLQSSLSNYSLLSTKPDESYQKYTSSAYWCYQQLLEPVLKELKDIEHLIIVPDGKLGYFPFEVFLVEPAPQDAKGYKNLHYLINDYQVSYNYSATLWKENKEGQTTQINDQILAMSGSYNNQIDSVTKSLRLPVYNRLRELLKPLPAARQEVERLEKHFQGHFAFDSLASESSFKQKASEYGIIHLAMHGVLDNNNPILSSLAFTEDGGNIENNFLQAYEISKMELNAALIVLSACETGYGKFETGNGVASLARAFMYVGVPSLVVSLWSVNDQSTANIMQSFYQYLSEGKNKAVALRQAKLDYLKRAKGVSAHPAFWSPFVQLGDSKPIELATKGEYNWLWWVLGAGILFLLSILQQKVSNNNKE